MQSYRNPWFAFLVHPRDLNDVVRSGAGAFLYNFSDNEEHFRAKLRSVKPTVVSELRFGFSDIWGEAISIGRLPDEMSGPGAVADVVEGVKVALKRGAGVIGLGGLTSPVTGGGSKLLRYLPEGVTITNGNAFTAAIVRRNVMELAKGICDPAKVHVAVVGCTGSVGVPAVHLLAKEGFALTLIGRTANRASTLLSGVAPNAIFSGEMSSLANADIVVLLTSDEAARLQPEMVKPSAMVIDFAEPANICDESIQDFYKRGIVTHKGGLVNIPGFSTSFDFLPKYPGTVFACLAETYLFAKQGIREHSVGRPSPDLANRLDRLAREYCIQPRPILSVHDSML